MISRVPAARSWSRFVRLRVSLIWPEVVAIQVCVLVAAVLRGLDYLASPLGSTRGLSVIEQALPMPLWGWLFLLGGLLGLLGLVADGWPLSAVGHVVLASVYAGFAVGSLIEVLSRSPIEGWRTPADWALVFAVIHWGYADAALDVWRERRRGGGENIA